jgi:integrase/recombinase XerD
MTGQSCIRNNSHPNERAAAVQKKHWPVILPLTEKKGTSSDFISPQLYCSPTAGSLAVLRSSKRRRALDRFSVRLADSDLTGADIAIEYLQDKYSKNQAVDTITQAGGVILFFLTFLNEIGTNIFEITRKDITSFVQNEQDRGLKVSSVKCYLRTVYAFINFLVEQEILPDKILHKKILIKLPELLPRAIPSEDIETLLAAINKVRDRALILLLLRTGMRIGELLNVKVADIILPERKILLYLGEKNYQGRVVYFGEDAEVALHEWLRIRKQKKYLFYSPTRENLSYVAAWMVMKKILERAGLSHKGYSLHSLRHTFATDMLNAGLRVEVLQRLLGHQSLDITMRYARMSNTTRESEYFKAMTVIEQGEHYESYRVNSQLQAVFEEKKLLTSHSKKLPA